MNKNIRFFVYLLLIGSASSTVSGQQTEEYILKDMAFYADAAMNSVKSEHRHRANDSVVVRFETIISNPASFRTSFESMPWISVLMSPDSAFRLYTWQLNQGDSLFTYYGYIQLRDGSYQRLTDNEPSLDLSYAVLQRNQWRGARYYEIVPFDYKNSTAYLLLGFDAHSRWNRQKVAESMYFNSGEVEFGIPVFGKEGINFDRNGKCRLELTYSLETKAVLTYDTTLQMLVHDHFISFDGRFPGQGRTQVPDGSYEGYKLDASGHWIYKEKLFDQVMEKPPVDSSRLSPNVNRDLFGRKRKRN